MFSDRLGLYSLSSTQLYVYLESIANHDGLSMITGRSTSFFVLRFQRPSGPAALLLLKGDEKVS
jgi:hypothetical protein